MLGSPGACRQGLGRLVELLGERQESSQHPPRSAAQILLGQSSQNFPFCCFRGAHVSLHHLLRTAGAFRKGALESSSLLGSQGMAPDPPTGTGCEFIAVAQTNSLAGIAVSWSHQGTETLASDAAYGNLSSRLGELRKSPEAGQAGESLSPARGAPSSA